MTAPVDHDLLADYVGGALEGTPEADRVAELIATSTAWRAAADSLTQALGAVSQDLQTFSGYQESMPADVAERFDDLFASPSFASSPRDPLAARPLERRVPAARPKTWRKWAVPVAAAVAVVGGFLIVRGLPVTTSPTASNAETAIDSLSQKDAAGAGAAPVPTISSGTNYTRQSTPLPSPIAPAVQPDIASKGSEEVLPGQSLMRASGAGSLQPCLEAVAKVLPGTPTLVDYAKFEGKPALVISITSGAQRWMFVAGPNCGVDGPAEIYRAPLK